MLILGMSYRPFEYGGSMYVDDVLRLKDWLGVGLGLIEIEAICVR